MKTYIVTKTVSATPAWRVDGKVYPKDGAMPRSMNREDGYEVVHEDGSKTWLSKKEFEDFYKKAETFLDRLKNEYQDLYKKTVDLNFFIDTKKFNEIEDDYQKFLLKLQHQEMLDYFDILATRIERLSDIPESFLTVMNFGMAIKALKLGYIVRRREWDCGLCVIKQVSAHITEEIIPKMQSLPQSAKKLILNNTGFIDYKNQCLLYNTNLGIANSWTPTIDDVFAEDWEIIE